MATCMSEQYVIWIVKKLAFKWCMVRYCATQVKRVKMDWIQVEILGVPRFLTNTVCTSVQQGYPLSIDFLKLCLGVATNPIIIVGFVNAPLNTQISDSRFRNKQIRKAHTEIIRNTKDHVKHTSENYIQITKNEMIWGHEIKNSVRRRKISDENL